MPCGAVLEIGWIPVRKTVARDDEVHASDHIEIQLRVLPILEQEEQHAIVRDELEQRGWVRQPDGSLTKTFGDALATLPPNSSRIRLEVELEQAVTASATASGTAREEDLAAQDKIAEQAAAAAEKKLERARQDARAALEQKNIDRLLRVQGELEAEVAQVVKATTKRALQQRASQLGSIDSMIEGKAADGSYELTITVKT